MLMMMMMMMMIFYGPFFSGCHSFSKCLGTYEIQESGTFERHGGTEENMTFGKSGRTEEFQKNIKNCKLDKKRDPESPENHDIRKNRTHQNFGATKESRKFWKVMICREGA